MDDPLHGLTQRQFTLGFFWTKNKLLIKRGVVIFLSIFNALVLIYVLWGLLSYFLFGWAEHKQNLVQFFGNYSDYSAWQEHIEPVPLVYSDITILASTPGHYDFLVAVENLNTDWMVYELVYRFEAEGVDSPERTFFLYPGEKKFLTDLGVVSSVRPSNVQLIVTSVRWKRVLDHEALFSARHNFAVDALEYQGAGQLALGASSSVSRVSFDVTNKTAFDYWEVGFLVTLTRGDRVLGINSIALSDLLSYEKRHVDLNFFGTFGGSADVKVVPQLNIYDSSVYRPLSVRYVEENREEVQIYSEQFIRTQEQLRALEEKSKDEE